MGRLGILSIAPGASLAGRLAWITAARLLLLFVLLGLVSLFYAPAPVQRLAFTAQASAITVAGAFALAGAYAVWLRTGRRVERLANLQLGLDQVTWTIVVYLSGGAASGATSLYGLTCIAGAVLTGLRGAATAAAVGAGCFATLVAGLQFGWIPPPPDQPALLYRLLPIEVVYYSGLNLLALGTVTVLSGYLAERLRHTGGRLVVAEERAERAERMAALGRLAAGLAHEIRNPLGSISGSIRLLKDGPGLSDEDRVLCEIVAQEAARLDDLVTDMVDLTRERKPALGDVDLARLARDLVALAGRSGRAGSDVEVVYEGVDSAPVRADAAQLRQMIWNLVRNAVQASSAGERVRVIVSLTADQAAIEVSDDGPGIEPDARARIFDAFFTTRSKGTGVGLAVVKRIVDDHGFDIEVESDQGSGATFRVFMPHAPARGLPSEPV